MIALDHQGMSHSKSQLPISFLRLKDSKLAFNIGDVSDSSSHYHYSFFADLINETLPSSFSLKIEIFVKLHACHFLSHFWSDFHSIFLLVRYSNLL